MQSRVRDLAPVLIDHRPTRLGARERALRAGAVRRIDFVIGHGHDMVTRNANASCVKMQRFAGPPYGGQRRIAPRPTIYQLLSSRRWGRGVYSSGPHSRDRWLCPPHDLAIGDASREARANCRHIARLLALPVREFLLLGAGFVSPNKSMRDDCAIGAEATDAPTVATA